MCFFFFRNQISIASKVKKNRRVRFEQKINNYSHSPSYYIYYHLSYQMMTIFSPVTLIGIKFIRMHMAQTVQTNEHFAYKMLILFSPVAIIGIKFIRMPKQSSISQTKALGSCLKTGQHSIFVFIRKIKKLIHVCWIPQIDDFIFIMEQYFHY